MHIFNQCHFPFSTFPTSSAKELCLPHLASIQALTWCHRCSFLPAFRKYLLPCSGQASRYYKSTVGSLLVIQIELHSYWHDIYNGFKTQPSAMNVTIIVFPVLFHFRAVPLLNYRIATWSLIRNTNSQLSICTTVCATDGAYVLFP